jgi:adenylosuccinate lyase
MNQNIYSLTSLDGRYEQITQKYRDIFSEYALIRERVHVEVQWLKFLLSELKFDNVSEEELLSINKIAIDFNDAAANEIKEIEKTTKHDVKAVEYFIRKRLDIIGLGRLKEWVHFACTSEDINNISYALMMDAGRKLLLTDLQEVLIRLENFARAYKVTPMLSRTHGQAASPTTVGKEFVNFAFRLRKEMNSLSKETVEAKINGATGNYNAHVAAFPQIDWISASERFLKKSLNLQPILFTTQINPYHYIASIFHSIIRIASTLNDIDRDMWGYISLGYFKQKTVSGEVGSSTMPHKVNPIDFENSEGNLGMAIALMQHMSTKLLNSRFQRDLTDSTVLRNIGAVFGYMTLSIANTLKGLNKIDIDVKAIENDLLGNIEVLAEPIQTVLRVYGYEDPYEKLKLLTRGHSINQEDITNFINSLNLSPEVTDRLLKLSPVNYIGLAGELVDKYFQLYP